MNLFSDASGRVRIGISLPRLVTIPRKTHRIFMVLSQWDMARGSRRASLNGKSETSVSLCLPNNYNLAIDNHVTI